MRNVSEYIFPFSGKKVGQFKFDYKIEKEFFDAFEYSEIKDGSLNVVVLVNKSETMMVMNFEIKGELVLVCDICLGAVRETIVAEYRQIFKFSDDEDLKLDDEITLVSSSEHEIDLAPFILEFITLSKPNKSSHQNNECDEELVSVLEEYLLVEESEIVESIEEDEIDPRWNALKKLKNK